MAIVISKKKMENYNVNPYHFKVLSGNNDEFVEEQHQVIEQQNNKVEEKVQKQPITEVDSSAISSSSKDALIESLMKNNDEMSSNFIKLQMKIEAKEEEYKKEIEKAKEIAFNEGVVKGQEQAKQNYEADLANRLTQFATSITTLDEKAKEFLSSLEAIKNSLMSAAIDIASEVINVELNENSASIAKVLSHELIKELQSASKITLKVNPNDYVELSGSLGNLEHIEVVSDSAISKGGVIAISDVGNIDAQISKRFQRVKKAALGE